MNEWQRRMSELENMLAREIESRIILEEKVGKLGVECDKKGKEEIEIIKEQASEQNKTIIELELWKEMKEEESKTVNESSENKDNEEREVGRDLIVLGESDGWYDKGDRVGDERGGRVDSEGINSQGEESKIAQVREGGERE